MKCIALLQRYNKTCGMDDVALEKEAEKMYELMLSGKMENDVSSLEELIEWFKIRPKTNILANTNSILSPIEFDNNVELPIAELFLDTNNFVVYTTQSIYNNRSSKFKKNDYKDIINIDHDSMLNFFINARMLDSKLYYIDLVMASNEKIPISFEYSVAMRPINCFLIDIIKLSKAENWPSNLLTADESR